MAATNHRTAAFFDLDRTLLTVNSGALWMKREHRLGRISNWMLLQGTFYLLAYKFDLVDMNRVTVKALHTVKGEYEPVVKRWTEQWYAEEVAQHAAPGAWPVLAEHREQGHPLVLLTSSSPYESAMAQEQFGLDGVLCTRYQLDRRRRFTGYPVWPVCYGAGKVVYAERYASRHGIDLEASHFYTDSMTDLPMLERVGHPHVVNPDPRLARTARRRGWPILDWHQSNGAG